MITPYRDDGSVLSMILPAAVWQLHLKGETEVLALRTVRSDFTHIKGESVHVEISPISVPTVRYAIQPAFTVKGIDLIDQTLAFLERYPSSAIQEISAPCFAWLR